LSLNPQLGRILDDVFVLVKSNHQG